MLQLMQMEKASGRSCSVWQIWNQSNETKKAWDGLIWCSVWRMMWSFQLFTFIMEIANYWLNALKSMLCWMSKYQTTLSSDVKYGLLLYFLNSVRNFRLMLPDVFCLPFFISRINFQGDWNCIFTYAFGMQAEVLKLLDQFMK